MMDTDPTDQTWVILGFCLLFVMQLGFAMLETGCIGHQSNHQSATLLKVRCLLVDLPQAHLQLAKCRDRTRWLLQHAAAASGCLHAFEDNTLLCRIC